MALTLPEATWLYLPVLLGLTGVIETFVAGSPVPQVLSHGSRFVPTRLTLTAAARSLRVPALELPAALEYHSLTGMSVGADTSPPWAPLSAGGEGAQSEVHAPTPNGLAAEGSKEAS